MNKQQFIKEEKDCTSLMGLTLKEYRQSLKNVKANNNISQFNIRQIRTIKKRFKT